MTERKLVNLGPKIGLVVLPEKVISKLIKITDKTVNTNDDYGYSLAGQIANQKILDEKDLGEIWNLLTEEISIYLREVLRDLDPAFDKKSPLYKNLEIKAVIDSMWTVSQFENEYNPVHFHSGMEAYDLSTNCQLSSVMYLKTPQISVRELGESEKQKRASGQNSPDGAIDFISSGYGHPFLSLTKGTRRFRPVVGHLFIFPSWLLHTVYPFIGEGERRSISFNSSYKIKN